MKRFKQYLIERLDNEMDSVPTSATQKPKDLVAPNRRDYADTPEGAEQWKSDTRDFASKTKSQAKLETEQAKSTYDTLGKVETGLKIADTAADTALSAGAVAVPGVGTALNAGVKMLKAGKRVMKLWFIVM